VSLADFEQWLQENLPEAAESLNPAATEQELARLSDETAVILPVQLVDLYRWHNGQQKRCPTGIFYGLRFMPLADVLKEWPMKFCSTRSRPTWPRSSHGSCANSGMAITESSSSPMAGEASTH
jgi:cell wall assembly regulator SMI1